MRYQHDRQTLQDLQALDHVYFGGGYPEDQVAATKAQLAQDAMDRAVQSAVFRKAEAKRIAAILKKGRWHENPATRKRVLWAIAALPIKSRRSAQIVMQAQRWMRVLDMAHCGHFEPADDANDALAASLSRPPRLLTRAAGSSDGRSSRISGYGTSLS